MPHTAPTCPTKLARPRTAGVCRSAGFAAAGAILLAAACAGQAAVVIPSDVIAVQVLQVQAAVALGQTVLAEDTDGVLASTSFGSSWARADTADGTLRGLAVASDDGLTTVHSNSGLALQLLNTSARTASFAAGALRMDVHGSFGRSLPGAVNLGVAGNTLVATLGVVIVDPAGQERTSGALALIYTWTGEPGDEPARISAAPAAAGALGGSFALDGLSFDGSRLNAIVSAPALQLLPGETLAIVADASGGAVALGLAGSSGFSATTDYGSTARLALALPTNFNLQSAQPLPWVVSSPVPEPAAAGLLAAGMGLLAWCRRGARSRPSCAPSLLH